MIQNLYKLVNTPSHMEWNRIKQENAEYFLDLKWSTHYHLFGIPWLAEGWRSSFLCIFLLFNSLCSLSCVMLYSWLFCDNRISHVNLLLCYFLILPWNKAYLLIYSSLLWNLKESKFPVVAQGHSNTESEVLHSTDPLTGEAATGSEIFYMKASALHLNCSSYTLGHNPVQVFTKIMTHT